MKINLSKKEIEEILEWRDIAIGFLASHQWAQSPKNNKTKNRVMCKLEKKLAKAIGQEGRYDVKFGGTEKWV